MKSRKKDVEKNRRNARILAEGLYMDMDGKWTQRNNNEVCFGASGAGKTRFYLTPNLLQLSGCYVVVDSSGDIEQNTAGFFQKNGYVIKRFSTDDIKPQVVDSARRRAREAEKRRKEKHLEKELAGERLKEADETKSREALERVLIVFRVLVW